MTKPPTRRGRRPKQQQLISPPPIDLHAIERTLAAEGVARIAGIDEAGRGCLAGPVVAAAVILPFDRSFDGLTDSKQLTPKRREDFFDRICREAVAVAVATVGSREIDRINILQASLKAMRLAVEGLREDPDYLLIDGINCIESRIPQRAIKKGDCRSISIAAASVIAKVTRDRLMCDCERRYPEFRFSVHKGYGTPQHLEELGRYGPTPIHRLTFQGVRPEGSVGTRGPLL